MREEEIKAKKQQFGIWLGMPESSREPKTIIELAKQIGAARETLIRWKKLPEVQEIAKNALQVMALGHNLEIWNKTIEGAKTGNAMDRRLYFQLTNQLKQVESKSPVGKFIVEYVTDGAESKD